MKCQLKKIESAFLELENSRKWRFWVAMTWQNWSKCAFRADYCVAAAATICQVLHFLTNWELNTSETPATLKFGLVALFIKNCFDHAFWNLWRQTVLENSQWCWVSMYRPPFFREISISWYLTFMQLSKNCTGLDYVLHKVFIHKCWCWQKNNIIEEYYTS